MSHENIANIATGATYTGSAIAAGAAAPHYVFGLTMDEWSVLGIIFGMATAMVGLAVNWYYRRAHFKLAEARVEAEAPDGD